MSDPLIRACDYYAVFEPGKKEKILSSKETIEWLENWLTQFDHFPTDLLNQPSINSAAKHLLNTACDLEIEPGFTLQWFAVRINPSEGV